MAEQDWVRGLTPVGPQIPRAGETTPGGEIVPTPVVESVPPAGEPIEAGTAELEPPVAPTPMGTVVHYVSYGTPNGEYGPRCRAAVVTEMGAWITAETHVNPDDDTERHLVQKWDDQAAALMVLNPTGVFWNGAGTVPCRNAEEEVDGQYPGGTWHRRGSCTHQRADILRWLEPLP